MQIKYYTSQPAPNGTNGNLYVSSIVNAGELNLLLRFYFDNDDISDTYAHWVCVVDVIDDVNDYPERSFVVYPNTAPFDYDDMFSIVVTSELDDIGFNDLSQVYITVGVPVNE